MILISDMANFGRGRDKVIRKKRIDKLGLLTLGGLGAGTLATTAYYGMKGKSNLGKLGIGAAMLAGAGYGYHRANKQREQRALNRN
jgi:hypothetical protein